MKKRTNVWLSLVIGLSLVALGSSCGPKTDTNAPEKPAGTAKAVPTTDLGSVTGVITFNGTPPAPKKIDTSADPVCGQKNPNLELEDTVVKDGKLANVFVYVKEGTAADGTKIGDYDWKPSSTAVQLDQNGCHYRPHVLGIQAKQKLTITNSDATQHNIHPTPKVNQEWNQTQANGAAPIEKSFDRPEVLIPVKCNQHPWMKAYIGVMKTPFFDVSKEDGTFTIKGLPAGKYTVVAWKEGPGEGTSKTMEVTVTANGSAKADFAFGEGAAASNGSPLQMMPALEIPVVKH